MIDKEESIKKIENIINEYDKSNEGIEALENLKNVIRENEQLIKKLNRQLLTYPHLSNRGDGVDGHYCISRFNLKKECTEHFNEGTWTAFGELFKDARAAKSILFKLQFDHLCEEHMH